MKDYTKYDFNNKITLLVLLTGKLPPYRSFKNVTPHPCGLWNFPIKDGDDDIDDYMSSHIVDDDGYGWAADNYTDKIINDQMTPSGLRILEYVVAMQLNARLNSRNTPSIECDQPAMDHYSAKYIRITGCFIIHDDKHHITYLIHNFTPTDNTALSNMKIAFDYKKLTNPDDYNQVLINQLYKIKKHSIGRYTKPLEALRALWVAQTVKYKINPHSTKRQIKSKLSLPPSAKKLFLQLMVDTDVNRHTSPASLRITFQDVIDFYHEVQAGHLTNKTRAVQDWIFKGNSVKADADTKTAIGKLRSLLNMLQMRSNYHAVMNGIHEMSPHSHIVKDLKDQFHKNLHYHKYGFHLADVYKLDYPQRQIKGKYSFVGLHGTNSFSIPSILFSSLCNGKELDQLNKRHGDITDYRDTAQSFGPGIYFAALHDRKPHRNRSGERDTCGITKSLNYSNSHSDKYKMVFVATSTYNDPIHVGAYGDDIGNHDWLFSKDVGGSESLSEAVTATSKQIHLDYLCVFENNKY